DLQKQLESLMRRQLLLDCESRNRCTNDVVHDEVGETIISCACIEQSRDVWMIEPCQDLTFCLEAAQNFSGIRSSTQYFDRDLFLKLAISSFCQENCAHSASAKFTDDYIRSDALSDARRPLLPESGGGVLGAIFKAVGVLVQKRLRLGKERLSLFK